MLAIVSDLHLTDETTARNISPGAIKLFARHLKHRLADREKQVQELQLILLGDVFDLVRTSKWCGIPASDRPWNGASDPLTAMNSRSEPTADCLTAVIDGIAATPAAQALFDVVGELHHEMGNRELRVRYVIGNHDRLLLNFETAEKHLRTKFPSEVEVEFGTEIAEPEYGLRARHGHQWDAHNHGSGFAREVLEHDFGAFALEAHQVLTIGEVVTAELMSGLINSLSRSFPEADHHGFIQSMKDLNNLRPMTAIFEWIHWMNATGNLADKYLDAVGLALIERLEAVLGSRLARQWDALRPNLVVRGDLVDHLKNACRVVGASGPFRRLGRVLPAIRAFERLHSFFDGGLDHLARGALQDFEGPNSDFRYVVYGHTHDALQHWFASGRDGRVRLYTNVGTFLPLIQRVHRRGKGFSGSERLSFVTVFGKHEQGPSLECWLGSRDGTS